MLFEVVVVVAVVIVVITANVVGARAGFFFRTGEHPVSDPIRMRGEPANDHGRCGERIKTLGLNEGRWKEMKTRRETTNANMLDVRSRNRGTRLRGDSIGNFIPTGEHNTESPSESEVPTLSHPFRSPVNEGLVHLFPLSVKWEGKRRRRRRSDVNLGVLPESNGN